jgi:hypothetical protein
MTFARLTAWDSIATRRRRQSGPNFVTYSPSSAQHVRVRLELQAGAAIDLDLPLLYCRISCAAKGGR